MLGVVGHGDEIRPAQLHEHAELIAAAFNEARGQNVLIVFRLVTCALLAYVIEGYYDFGLWWFRVAVLIGCLLGALEAASRELTATA